MPSIWIVAVYCIVNMICRPSKIQLLYQIMATLCSDSELITLGECLFHFISLWECIVIEMNTNQLIFIHMHHRAWLFHCHFLFHVTIGMNLILHVGTQADLPPVPPNFPTCGDHLYVKLALTIEKLSIALSKSISTNC